MGIENNEGGYRRDEVVGERDGDVIPPDDIDALTETPSWSEEVEADVYEKGVEASIALFEEKESELESEAKEAARLDEIERYGTGYPEIVEIIEASIRSKIRDRNGAPQLKIGKDTIPLGEYLAADLNRAVRRGELTSAGARQLLGIYTKYSIGPGPRIERSDRSFRDAASAAANDFD